MSSKRAYWPALVIGLLGAVLVPVIVFVAWPGEAAAVGCDGTPFSRAAWSSGGDARTDEAHQLVACERLLGMTAPQLEQSLGYPVERDAVGPAWELGPDGMGIDSMFLSVELQSGRVVSASVWQS